MVAHDEREIGHGEGHGQCNVRPAADARDAGGFLPCDAARQKAPGHVDETAARVGRGRGRGERPERLGGAGLEHLRLPHPVDHAEHRGQGRAAVLDQLPLLGARRELRAHQAVDRPYGALEGRGRKPALQPDRALPPPVLDAPLDIRSPLVDGLADLRVRPELDHTAEDRLPSRLVPGGQGRFDQLVDRVADHGRHRRPGVLLDRLGRSADLGQVVAQPVELGDVRAEFLRVRPVAGGKRAQPREAAVQDGDVGAVVPEFGGQLLERGAHLFHPVPAPKGIEVGRGDRAVVTDLPAWVTGDEQDPFGRNTVARKGAGRRQRVAELVLLAPQDLGEGILVVERVDAPARRPGSPRI